MDDMPEPLLTALERVATLVLDDERLVRAVAAGRRKGQTPPQWRRTELRYVDLESGRHLQVVEYDETQAFTRNIPVASVGDEVAGLLGTPYGNWHVDTTDQTLQLRVTKKGEAQVHVAKAAGTRPPDRTHDRAKPRVIDPGQPFLRAIGITDRDGRIKPTRKDKYRQVEEFVRLLGPAVDDALAAGSITPDPLRVVDLGCGNAYLTFAARGYLGDTKELPTTLTGIDVKAQARDRNSRIAAELGWDSTMTFVQGAIADADLGGSDAARPDVARPDVVLALHACDTATDDALAVAVRARAPVILAAPCCHHDLQKQLRSGTTPDPYGLVTRHGILRERLADMLTDGLRAAILRIAGYRVDVVEFVDSAHTPRNLMIRAVSTGAPNPATISAALEEYRALTSTWGVRPALAALLAAELPELEGAG